MITNTITDSSYPTLQSLNFILPVFNSIKRANKIESVVDLNKAKKEAQRAAGKIGQQKGEKSKGDLTGKLMLKKGQEIKDNPNVLNLLTELKIDYKKVNNVTLKSLEDKGIQCAKADVVINVHFKAKKKETHAISLKSVGTPTQLAVHPRELPRPKGRGFFCFN